MPGKKEYKKGFSSPKGQEFNQGVSDEAQAKIDEEQHNFAQQLNDFDSEFLEQEKKKRRVEKLKKQKKLYCCCGEDYIGGKCAEAQLVLKAYLCTSHYSSG